MAGLQNQPQAGKPSQGAGKAPAARKPAKKTPAKLAAKTKPAASAPLKTAPPVAESPSKNSRLRELRTRMKLSQKALADKIGILQNHVSTLETGRRPMTLELAERLAKFFKVAPKSLMPSRPGRGRRERGE